jgi:hypothetical protein
VDTLNQVVPLLAGADVRIDVSFTGEQTVDTVLAPIRLTANENGDLLLSGIPLASGAIPADAMANLQAANVQQLNLSLQPTGIYVAANGQPLPTITWTEESLPVLTGVVGPMAGGEDLLNAVLPVGLGLGPNVELTLPAAEGAEAVEVPEEIDYTIQPVEAGENNPVINLTLGIDEAGNIVSLGGFTADDFASLGVNLPAIPADSLAALRDAGIQQVALDTEPGVLNVVLDGTTALSVNYDGQSVSTALDVAQPFMTDSPISDPSVNQALREILLPVALTSNVDVTIDLE